MAEIPENHQESLFRLSRRRKVFKKRTFEDHQGAEEKIFGTAELDESSEGVNAVQEDPNELLPVVRRPAAKKHGISFSSSGAANQGTARQDVPFESAFVPVVEKEAGSVLQSDRFTKPTGKVDVVEDKHLYVKPITIAQ